MNSLLVFKDEMQGQDRALIKGMRVEQLRQEHELKEGLSIAAALMGGKRGSVKVISISKDVIELETDFHSEPPIRQNIELIIGVPRPQTVKKILQLCACSGLKKIHFIKTAQVEKSYLQSKALKKENIDEEIRLGMQQAYDCIAPEVILHRSYSGFLKAMPQYPKALKLIAHGPKFFSEPLEGLALSHSQDKQVVLALGPEAGWMDREVDDFTKLGFKQVSLGERSYRVEFALAMLLGQLMG